VKFKNSLPTQIGIGRITVVPLFTVILLLIFFLLLTTMFTVPQRIGIAIPKAVTSDALSATTLIISITNEDVIHFNNQVVTLKELRKLLQRSTAENPSILIKSDRRASLGRVTDVWDICRELGIEKINLATTREIKK